MAPPLKDWGPCARCGRLNGAVHAGRHRTPTRISAARFGLDGSVCASCYTTLRRHPEAALKPAKQVGHWVSYGRLAWELAEAILAFRDSLDEYDPRIQAARLKYAVELAEDVTGKEDDDDAT